MNSTLAGGFRNDDPYDRQSDCWVRLARRGDRVGLGRITEENDFSNDVYCTFRANDEDAFDVKGHSDSKRAARAR